MAAIEQRFVAGLIPESGLWAQTGERSAGKPKWSEVHFAQSELDSGCGIYCLVTALVVLLGVPRAEVLKLASAKRGQLAKLWATAEQLYFEGSDARDLSRCVEALGGPMQATRHVGSAERVVGVVEAAVLSSALPLIRLVGRGFDHWAIASGIEREVIDGRPQRTHSLLVLDPGEAAPWLTAYTGRIDLRPHVHPRTAAQVASGRFTYRSVGGESVSVRIVEALVLRLAQPP